MRGHEEGRMSHHTHDGHAAHEHEFSPRRLRVAVAIHLGAYLLVNAILIWVDLRDGDGDWFYWPLLGWGAGVAYHAWAVNRRTEGHLLA
jgi:hypothetical protein